MSVVHTMNDFDKSPVAGMTVPPGRTRHVISVCVILAVVTLAVFWQVKDHEFINFDDNHYVTENKHVLSGVSLTNLKWALTTRYTGYWHP